MTTTRLLSATLVLCLSACGSENAGQPVSDAETNSESTSVSDGVLSRSPSAADARVFFISPADGDTVSNPFEISFGIEGMTLAKAGDDQAGSGHHHLIIDAGLPDLGQPIPANDHYIHYGDASTSTTRTFEPGTHTLQLLLGDYLHRPHDPPVASAVITIHVE